MRQKAFRRVRCVMIGVLAAMLAGCGADAPAQGGSATKKPQGQEQVQEEQPQADGTEDETQEVQKNEQSPAVIPADGLYTAVFETDSSMFHLNESCEGRALLSVEGGSMTIHVPLVSKSIVHLFAGTADEARAADESEWLSPVTETVTYSDGYTEEVYAFDVPVPAIDTEFGLALIGTKGKWYDHTVCVSDPQPAEGDALPPEEAGASETGDAAAKPENGTYRVKVTLAGGTGRADIESPALVTVSDDGIVARIVWSSPWYDYMIVDGVKYEPVNTDGNAVFEIPVAGFDREIAVTADTVAMSTPHEIAYTLVFDGADAQPAPSSL